MESVRSADDLLLFVGIQIAYRIASHEAAHTHFRKKVSSAKNCASNCSAFAKSRDVKSASSRTPKASRADSKGDPRCSAAVRSSVEDEWFVGGGMCEA